MPTCDLVLGDSFMCQLFSVIRSLWLYKQCFHKRNTPYGAFWVPPFLCLSHLLLSCRFAALDAHMHKLCGEVVRGAGQLPFATRRLAKAWSEPDVHTWSEAEHKALLRRIPSSSDQQQSQHQGEASMTCDTFLQRDASELSRSNVSEKAGLSLPHEHAGKPFDR